jgi:hypothetical protein
LIRLPPRKFRSFARTLTILRLEVETFHRRIASSDRKFRMSTRQEIYNIVAGR